MRILMRLIVALAVLALLGLWITRPRTDGPEALAGLTADLARGERAFTAAGCASCHMKEGATGADSLVLSGGQHFASPFGTFTAPNISPDETAGLGAWSALDLWNALHHGTSPKGAHYYPVFPYASYIKMTPQDAVDIHGYLMTLPPSDVASLPHDVGFPFNIRASLGGWKLLFLRDEFVMEGDLNEVETRGRYLVEAMGHCAECHSPRGLLGNLKTGADWMSGADNPAGGKFPDVAGLDWSESELEEYFTSGFTPDFDVAGGHMALVVNNLAALPASDRAAIIAYIERLPLD
ncbi:MAG: c-type cytochrome [Maritimibacter sp.]